jgi:hypothetical protein
MDGEDSVLGHNSATFAPSVFHGMISPTSRSGRSMAIVMETNITDYRLERWIAAVLALLFFLPFIAR